MKGLTKTDRLFITVLAAVFLYHIFFLRGPSFLFDEPFYVSVPFRLLQGDSLVRDEWHLSQFSALFSYLPVRFWCALQGSADGLIVFMRWLYLALHTAAAVLIYAAFRKTGKPAVAAAVIFYLQTPYRIYSISYLSMFALFLLLFSFSLLRIRSGGAKKHCFAAGVFFGACCVNNPLFFAVSLLYLPLCLLWRKRNGAAGRRLRARSAGRMAENAGKRTAAPGGREPLRAFAEGCGCFFRKQTVLYGALGVGAVAAVGVLFFLATGGTFGSVFRNLKYLLASSEYLVASLSIREKLVRFHEAVNGVSFHMPFLLPLLFAAMLIDKKRKNNAHRVVYLSAATALGILFIAGIIRAMSYEAFFFSLPFALLSLVCFVLTENRNYKLFVCMWCPCAAAAVGYYFASNTLLSSIGTVAAVGNIAGVFFAWDLFNELRPQRERAARSREKSVRREKTDGGLTAAGCALICAGFVLQIGFYAGVLTYGQTPSANQVRVYEGPYRGVNMSASQFKAYEDLLRDMDIVKAYSEEDAPLLVVGYQNWLYLYAERPVAAYTEWFTGTLKEDALLAYYRINPRKIPKHIYVVNSMLQNVDRLRKMFSFTEETLSGGTLLTVTGCRFDSRPPGIE